MVAYDPPSNYYGLKSSAYVIDSLQYTAANAYMYATQSATVSLAVTQTAQPPTAIPSTRSTTENTQVLIQLRYTLTTVGTSAAPLVTAFIVQPPVRGTLCQLNVVNNQLCGAVITANDSVTDSLLRVVYTPPPYQSSNDGPFDNITFIVVEQTTGSYANIALVTLYVMSVSIPPIASDATVIVPSDGSSVAISLEYSDHNIADPLTVHIKSMPARGTLMQQILLANGTLTTVQVNSSYPLLNRTLWYNNGNQGSAYPFGSFVYEVVDSDRQTANGTVTLTVNCPPGLVNNVFLSTGPVCVQCPRRCRLQSNRSLFPGDCGRLLAERSIDQRPTHILAVCANRSVYQCRVAFVELRCGLHLASLRSVRSGLLQVQRSLRQMSESNGHRFSAFSLYSSGLRARGHSASHHLQAQAGSHLPRHRHQLRSVDRNVCIVSVELARPDALLVRRRLLHQLQRGLALVGMSLSGL